MDDEWEKFLESGEIERENIEITDREAPKASDLYISTKTKIVYLNKNIDLDTLFWDIDILPYDTESSGIIKKQMKFISDNKEELANLQYKLTKYKYYEESIIKHIEQQQSDVIIYRDVRKVSIGLNNKDLLNSRSKKKSAFYNCFVLIIRILYKNEFKEVHLKVFNTGKLEIPGVQDDELFDKTLNYVKNLFIEKYDENIDFKYNDKGNITAETVLINSNFDCGYCINRGNLFNILKNKHNLNVSFDPCSYPGIQCKYDIGNNKTVSFMIFRTGSILIVGRCENESILDVYTFLKTLLNNEYSNVCEKYKVEVKNKDKKKITKTKTIFI